MKIIQILLYLSILSNISLGANTSIINGKVANYDKSRDESFIKICTTRYGTSKGQICEDYDLKEGGEYTGEIEIYRENEFLLCYMENCIRFPILPDQEIYIEIEAKEFRTARRIPKLTKSEGDNNKTYQLIVDYYSKHLEKFYYYYYHENKLMQRELDYNKYGEYQIKYLNSELSYLSEYIETNKVKDEMFEDWAKSWIKYRSGYNMNIYHYLRSNPVVDQIPEDYGKMMEDLYPENGKGLTWSNQYQIYLHYRKMALISKYQHSQEAKELIKNNEPLWEGQIKFLKENLKGLSKDIILGEEFSLYIERGQGRIVLKYLEEIEDEHIKNMILEKLKKHKVSKKGNLGT